MPHQSTSIMLLIVTRQADITTGIRDSQQVVTIREFIVYVMATCTLQLIVEQHDILERTGF